MTTYLGLNVSTIAILNLILQTIAYFILLIGFRFARKNNFRKHGMMMGTAILLNLVSLAVVMLPAFYSIITATSFNLKNSITILHHSLGLITFIMAIVAIAVLRPCGTIMGNKKLGNVKTFMVILFIIWSITYFFGIIIYLRLYSSFFY
jgi:uncharacterized membrane protein YozB (DUF420 family)